MYTQVPVIELQEWQDTTKSDLTLTVKDKRLLETIVGIKIQDMRDSVYIKTSSWIGVISFDNFVLRIKPKLDNLHIVRMLMLTQGLNRLKQFDSRNYLQIDEQFSLLDLIALLLVNSCNIIVRDGFLRGYVVEEDDLPVIRGRLRVSDQVRKRYGRVDRLECRFDDHHANVLENQILYSALSLCSRYVEHPQVKLQIRHLVEMFSTECESLKINWHDAQSNMIYHRLNSRYREAHNLAWIIFQGMGIDNLFAQDNIRAFSFLLDMNALFEAFITQFLHFVFEDEVFKDKVRIDAQAKTPGHIWDVNRNQSYTQIIPDLLLTSNKSSHRLSIDAKYKRYDVWTVDQSDIYQTFLYAYAFRDASEHLPSALILYPSDSSQPNLTRLQVRDSFDNIQAQLHALGIDVIRALDELYTNTHDTMSTLVRDTVEKLL